MTRAEQLTTVRALLKTLDQHSPGEMRHAERVAVFAVAVGEHLGLPDDRLNQLADAAMLHDVGKVRVDAKVLRKVGDLETEDWDILRLHAELCVHLIEEFDFLAPCVPWIRHHHERWDGKGYPDGLAGAAIPLEARILATCEAYDVIRHGSPWSAARDDAEASREIQAGSGTQYDPEVVNALLAVRQLIQPSIV